MEAKQDVTLQLAEYVCGNGPAAYSESDLQMAKLCILDWIGAAMTGVAEKATQIILDYEKENVKRDSTIIGQNRKSSMATAALVNGMESHAIDFDDIHDFYSLHLCSPVMPAALAVAERQKASGKEFIDAIMKGVQIMVSIANAIMPEHYNLGRWHATSTIGIFGAAAAAGSLLHLTPAEMTNTFGICAGLCSGIQLNFGTMSKPLVVGNASKNGVMAAELAQQGFTGRVDIFDTDFLDNIALKKVDKEGILQRLHGELGIHELRLKFYPCGAPTHSGILNCKKILQRHPSQVKDIEKIIFYPYPRAIRLVGIQHPKTGLEGKFSIPFTAAAQIVFGKVMMDTFTDENVKNPDIVYLLDRMEMIPDDSFTPSRGGKTVMVFKDGTVEENSTYLLGHPIELPEYWQAEKEKFFSIMEKMPKREDAHEIWDKVVQLEKMQNVQQLCALL